MNHIGQKIKGLRMAENLTQEKLAEELNVSFQSISRWENGTSTPDISLLPLIARFFKVSTDYLLGMHDEENEETKQEVEAHYLEKRNLGDLDGAYETLLEGRKLFPREFHFCVELAEIMDLFEGGNEEQISKYKAENFSGQIFNLCTRVLEGSRDDADRSKALTLLASFYMKAGNTTEALKIANSMTEIMCSKEVLLGNILTGEEKMKRLQENLLLMSDYIADTLVKIAFQKEYGFSSAMLPEDKLSHIIAANSILTTILSDGNYLVYSRKIGWNYRRMGELYLLMNQKDKALECLLEAEKMANIYDTINPLEISRFSAPFCNLVESRMENNGKYFAGTEREMLAYRLDEMRDYFQGDEAFGELRKRLGQTHIKV